ncbi:filamentous hemagglutinin N-terminal domain-containing protein [Myxosarcina sp. GI1]|uniref:two-partner secretion domain-containing protein n=1 Tax=Myxosarcina sp. GI1 TaxID=1541065 RepID=UPI00068FC00B|nr:filamentous hemagglutinin N-terminal domain-containing protein [Myxosarcina sp. GI1]
MVGYKRLGFGLLISSWTSCLTTPVLAQITPDSSLGNENSTVIPNASVKDAIADLIEGGAIRGNNLFHSFEQFNVSDGNSVYFASPDGIANILTRVTGDNISEIFGTLGVDGTANLFLLNPNGIVFGENAALDVNGSFFATTADSFVFKNGFEYSATNADAPPLLTVNIPIGLQMGDNPGQIRVIDSGHSIVRQNDFAPFINLDNSKGLRLKPDSTLTLIGGKISLEGGNILAPNGQIQLASIAKGKIRLNATDTNNWTLDYSEAEKFQNINLLQKALVDVSGISSGSIQLRGADIILTEGSVISSNSLKADSANKIDVKFDNLQVIGVDVPTLTRSGIVSIALDSGKNAEIFLEGNNLLVANGGIIGSFSFSQIPNQAGDVNLEVSDLVSVDGLVPADSVLPSSIITANFGQGNAGNLNLNSSRIEVLAAGTISSLAFGSGKGGNVTVRATESIAVKGIDFNTFIPSLIGSNTVSIGDAGNLQIDTAKLIVSDGGRLDSSTYAKGSAGNVNINASESIEIFETSPNFTEPSVITSAARVVNPVLQQIFSLPPIPGGDGGSLSVKTPQLEVANGAQISVRNDGLGDAGSLSIDADSILLEAAGGVTASTKSGNGGNINLQVADTLLLRDRGFISAEAKGTGNGGNIHIDAGTITPIGKSSIVANALKGNGGNIKITTKGLFVAANSAISASSELGLDGTVDVRAISIDDRHLEIFTPPETPIDPDLYLDRGCEMAEDSYFVNVGRGSRIANPLNNVAGFDDLLPDLGTNKSDLNFSLEQTLDFSRTPSFGKGDNSSVVEAQTWILNRQGNVELVTVSGQNFLALNSNDFDCSGQQKHQVLKSN